MPGQLPERPVRFFCDGEDPYVRRLHVHSYDNVGGLFKLCELLGSHGFDVASADVTTEDGIASNRFELHTSRLGTDRVDAPCWSKEVEEFVKSNAISGNSGLEGSLAAFSKRLSVNPDLLCVVAFLEVTVHEGPPGELRYDLEIQGINQAGLLTYTALILYRSGFSVVKASVSTTNGLVSNFFQISAPNFEAERRLRSYFDIPSLLCYKTEIPLPFQVIASSDMGLQELWERHGNAGSPHSPLYSSWYPSPHDASVTGDGDEVRKTRSRLSSADVEEPLASGSFQTHVAKNATKKSKDPCLSAVSSNEDLLASKNAADDKPAVDKQRMIVNFANGDVYSGSCVVCTDGAKTRHGFGTYEYTSSSHETYKQYRGQWREDQKHGFGVLLYKNGGIYVGQWEKNKKHGVGVFMDNAADEHDQPLMPSYRYEGIWRNDEVHGMGAEDTEQSAYFGTFDRGKRSGPGVRMDATTRPKSLLNAEVVGSEGKVLPLLDALEEEMNHFVLDPLATCSGDEILCATGGSSPKVRQSRSASPEQSDPAVQSSAVGCSEDGSNSSWKVSDSTQETHTPASSRVPRTARSDLDSTPTDDQVTPMLATCNQGTPDRFTRTMSLREFASKSESLTPLVTSRCVSSPSGRSRALPMTQLLSEGSEPSRPQDGIRTALQCVESNQRTNGEAPATRVSTWHISPKKRTQFTTRSAHRDLQRLSPRRCRVSASDPWDVPTSKLATGSSIVMIGVSELSEPNSPCGDLHCVQGASGNAASCVLGTSILRAQTSTNSVLVERQMRKPVRTPILWSEDELAAFLACLGISQEVCLRIKQRKLKGVSHLLEMSNADLRKDFGLSTPVERLVVRQSLKRLLEADRWENSVRANHKPNDLASDSVLGKCMLPLKDLTLVTKISQGGYGTVYRAYIEKSPEGCVPSGKKTSTPMLVAAKEMRGERRVRFSELLKEACVMASLRHPNICRFIGVCADGNCRKHYIVSELMDCSLFDVVHQPYKLRWHGRLTVSTVLSLSVGICAGICYIHGNHLVHADLKSPNILIDYSSSWHLIPRICDFGHAAVRTFPSPHHRCGTPHWAAPEVLRSEALGPKADIYSFGVIMWEMLTQRLPHKGLSFGQVLAAVGWASWGPDLELLPELPTDVRRLLRDCISFTPTYRPTGDDVQYRLRIFFRQSRLEVLRKFANILNFVGIRT